MKVHRKMNRSQVVQNFVQGKEGTLYIEADGRRFSEIAKLQRRITIAPCQIIVRWVESAFDELSFSQFVDWLIGCTSPISHLTLECIDLNTAHVGHLTRLFQAKKISHISLAHNPRLLVAGSFSQTDAICSETNIHERETVFYDKFFDALFHSELLSLNLSEVALSHVSVSSLANHLVSSKLDLLNLNGCFDRTVESAFYSDGLELILLALEDHKFIKNLYTNFFWGTRPPSFTYPQNLSCLAQFITKNQNIVAISCHPINSLGQLATHPNLFISPLEFESRALKKALKGNKSLLALKVSMQTELQVQLDRILHIKDHASHDEITQNTWTYPLLKRLRWIDYSHLPKELKPTMEEIFFSGDLNWSISSKSSKIDFSHHLFVLWSLLYILPNSLVKIANLNLVWIIDNKQRFWPFQMKNRFPCWKMFKQ